MGKSHKPEIAVIICSYNRARHIVGAMDSLYSQTVSRERYEVIVVDNNSTDDTGDVCDKYIREHPDYDIRYFTENRQGSSHARNKGARESSAPLLAFMDDDAVAETDFIERMLVLFEELPQAAGAGGRIIPKYIPEEPVWMSYFVSSLVGNFDYGPERCEFKNGKYPLESNMALRRRFFEALEGFSADQPGVVGGIRIGGEGKDLFNRLRELGGRIYYDPGIRVHHIVEVSKLSRKYLAGVAAGVGRGERSRIRAQGSIGLLFKNLEYIYKLGGSVVLAVAYALQGNPRKSMPVIRFRWNALLGLNDGSYTARQPAGGRS